MIYPISQIRADFPILSNRYIKNQPLIYLDSASTAQKPNVVIECEIDFYRNRYAAVHRGIHTLSNEATLQMENVRSKIAKFINASSMEEVIFVKGSTEGINLIANCWGRYFLRSGDNILITEMEHHANIVPWQILAQEKKLILRYIPLMPDGSLCISKILSLIDDRTRLFSITQMSNVLGIINPLTELINKIRTISNVVILVDGAQGIVHQKVNVQTLDCDFYVFSGHKIYGPSGIGILYGKKKLLNNMPPWEGGGSMIKNVSLTFGTTFNEIPWRFEAGSLHTAGIMGLGAAIDYINKIGFDLIQDYEKKLMNYTLNVLKQVPEIIIYGPYNNRTGIISFNLGSHHAYDVGTFLDQYGIAIRTGHHCAMPLMNFFQVSSMCRVSLAMYTTKDDIDCLVNGLIQIQRILK